MYWKLSIVVLGILPFACLVSAQEFNIVWENELDTGYLHSITQSSWDDESFAVAGDPAPDSTIWVAWFNELGDTVITVEVTASYPVNPKITCLPNGSIFLAATKWSDPTYHVESNVWFSFLDTNGEATWIHEIVDESNWQGVVNVCTHPENNDLVLLLVAWRQLFTSTWGYQLYEVSGINATCSLVFEYLADALTELLIDELLIVDSDEVYIIGREEDANNEFKAFVHRVDVYGQSIWRTDWGWTGNYWGNSTQVVACIVDEVGICLMYDNGFEGDHDTAIVDRYGNIVSTNEIHTFSNKYNLIKIEEGYLVSGVEMWSPVNAHLVFVDEASWGNHWYSELWEEGLGIPSLIEMPGGALLAGPKGEDNDLWIGRISFDLGLEQEAQSIALMLALHSVYPNPFNSSTTISFDLARPSLMDLRVFDLLGREVTVLGADMPYSPGTHSVVWNASGLPGGTYFLRAETEDEMQMRRMVFLK